MTPNRPNAHAALRADLLLVAFLVGIDVAARLIPHAPNFTPIAASALFAGSVLRYRGLALLVPVSAMLLADAVLGFDDWRMRVVIYAAISLPALVAFLPRRLRAPGMFAPVMIAGSLLFFVVTNFAVWAFGGLYPPTFAGLVACYVAALPFLQQNVVGDLFWAAVLFGGAALVQMAPRLTRRTI